MNGRPISNGDIVRLEHMQTHANLHSHPTKLFFNAGDDRMHEVTCYGHDESGDDNDNWRVECDGMLQPGSPFRLIHVNTNHALHSHDQTYPFSDQQQVVGFRDRDNNDFFKVGGAVALSYPV